MLSISTIRNVAYYTRFARYYQADGNPPGRWWGKGAEAKGLTGEVDNEEQLKNVLHGYGPDGEEEWIQHQKGKQYSPGEDVGANASKSLSILTALHPEKREQYLSIHRRAVEAALTYLEQNALICRRGKGGKHLEHAGGIVYRFEHHESRNGDIHIHTHCLFMRPGVCSDGKTRAREGKYLFQAKMRAGKVYQETEAKLLASELGLCLKKEKVGYSIEGIPPEVIRALSSRRQEIEKHLGESGTSGAAASARAALVTRKRKQHYRAEEVFERARTVAESLRFGRKEVLELVRDGERRLKERAGREKSEQVRDEQLTKVLSSDWVKRHGSVSNPAKEFLGGKRRLQESPAETRLRAREHARQDALSRAISEWQRAGGTNEPRGRVLTAPSFRDRAELNRLAQLARKAEGKLSGRKVQIKGVRYQSGDRVVFARGEGGTITRVGRKRITLKTFHGKQFRSLWSLLKYAEKVRANKDTYVTVKLDSGKTIELNAERAYFRLGYCLHPEHELVRNAQKVFPLSMSAKEGVSRSARIAESLESGPSHKSDGDVSKPKERARAEGAGLRLARELSKIPEVIGTAIQVLKDVAQRGVCGPSTVRYEVTASEVPAPNSKTVRDPRKKEREQGLQR